jgi:hypothetical protein
LYFGIQFSLVKSLLLNQYGLHNIDIKLKLYFMKKVLFGFIVSTLFSLGSCQKENLDSPGSIQGMGNALGNLEVKTPFTLPKGIALIGDISGVITPVGKVAKEEDSKSITLPCYGSGGKMIKLKLTLLNSGNSPKTIFFPKGLLWKCNISGYQHAILLQTTWISLTANSQRTIVIDLYCINYGLDPSDGNSTFQILGVSSSNVINNLLKIIGWRKINYEMIYGTFAVGKSGTAEVPTYEMITDRMQSILWNLTNNGIDISSVDRAFIESIPELPSSEIPALDSQAQFPEYFKEFVMPGK